MYTWKSWPGLCRQVSVLGHLQILQRCWSVGCCDSSPLGAGRGAMNSTCDMLWPCPTRHVNIFGKKNHWDSLDLLGESMTASFCKSLFTSLFRLSYNPFDRSTLRSMSTFCSSPSAPRHATPEAKGWRGVAPHSNCHQWVWHGLTSAAKTRWQLPCFLPQQWKESFVPSGYD